MSGLRRRIDKQCIRQFIGILHPSAREAAAQRPVGGSALMG